MIKQSVLNKNRDWSIGKSVNVGFMRGLVVESVKSIKDGLPDIYVLRATSGKLYDFIPHVGIYAQSHA